MYYIVDLHNHSCLSPCGDLSMSPSVMAAKAAARGIDIFALTDHNSALDCPAFAATCARAGVLPLFGLELNSAEEVHLLALFPTPVRALEFGASIRAFLPEYPWNPESLGDQPVVDDEEGLLGFEERWLGAAQTLSFDELGARSAAAGAIVIPAHVDRPMYSVHSQLAFLPSGPWDAVESMGPPPPELTGGLAAISGSDAHYPEHIGRHPTRVDLAKEPVEAMRKALSRFGESLEGQRDTAAQVRDDEVVSAEAMYVNFLSDANLRRYPEAEALALFEELRSALRAKRVKPGFLPYPLIRPNGGPGK
ncbi:MAG: PHP domain-containing protein [Spirochaetes bacterium]|nr:PHP domain-containing protein [Spirochaetota bacterium]